jgi:telomere length regulation protein
LSTTNIASRSDYNPFLTPSLLTAFIQTLTLLLHTLGPSSLSNHDVTHECFPILFSIRSLPNATEPTVLEALLSAFLAIIDLNAGTSTSEEMLVSDYAREVTELREWVGGVFERTPQSEEKVRMLAAGIMVKLGEVAERWERRLLGTASGF